MEEIVRSAAEHPLVAAAVGFAALLLAWLLFKSLVKLALILFLVAVVAVGYAYLRDPGSGPKNLRDAVERALTGTGRAVDRGMDVYEKGKEWVDLGSKVLDQGIDQGKDAVAKGKETANRIGKIVGEPRESGSRPKP